MFGWDVSALFNGNWGEDEGEAWERIDGID
jgi:hypothetical protein